MSLSQTLDKSKVVQNVVLNNAVLGGASGVTTSAVNVDNASSLAAVQLTTNAGSGQVQLFDPAGGRYVVQSYVNNQGVTNYVAPQWNPLLNYNNLQGYIVVYGVNTSPPGVYANNLFESYVIPPASTVVGTPPTSTAAPYPVGGPTPNSGWILCRDAAFFGGAAVLDNNGSIVCEQTIIGAGRPGTKNFFGGGGASLSGSSPRGVTIAESDITTASGNNGALLDVAGTLQADGIYLHNTDQSLSPASSANAAFDAGTTFNIGTNYTWSPTGPGASTYHWDAGVPAGVPGQTTLTGPALSMAFDPQCIMMVQRKYTAGTYAAGNLCVDSKTATTITISSRDPANSNLLITADLSPFEWICFNPNWAT